MEMIPVDSEAMNAVGYDPIKKELRIQFSSGQTHPYLEVSPEQHQGLMKAESKGRYFAQHIRPRPVAAGK